MRRSLGREPVEQAGITRHLGQQHHPGQEQIDIQAPTHAVECRRGRQQTNTHQNGGAGNGPYRFGEPERSKNDPGGGECGYAPDPELRSGKVHFEVGVFARARFFTGAKSVRTSARRTTPAP